MAVWLTGPRRQWVVLGSFIPLPYSGILFSLLFELNILLTLTLGSRDHVHPELDYLQVTSLNARWKNSLTVI